MGPYEEKPFHAPTNIFSLKNIWRRSDFYLFLLELEVDFPKKCFNMANIEIFTV